MNSTITLVEFGVADRPYALPCSRILVTTARLAGPDKKMLMNPAPATSARSTHGDSPSAATSEAASSRGLRLSVLASCNAMLLE
jgi:hypothetical protein